MIRSTLIAAALLAGLALGGCDSIPKPSPTGGTATTSPAITTAQEIKAKALGLCGWETTVASALQILSTASWIDTADDIAKWVCTAVTTIPLADGPGDRKPRVNGVVVQGRFRR